MEQLTIRATTVSLPALDERDELEPVDSLDTTIGSLSGFHYDQADLRTLELSGQRLLDGRISGLRVQRANLDDLRLDSVEFTGCDLSSLEWTKSKLSRVRFANCKILGGQFTELTLEDTVFDHCKLDFATFASLHAKGPVVFTACSLVEASFTSCDLTAALFDECTLRLTSFERGTYRGCDLRDNDLSTVQGVGALKKVVIDQAQMLQLAEALAADLEVSFGDDRP
jgi:uncharacterized protein YjbI with pentapeptide repeats